MSEMWFDPDAIRGDFESAIGNLFYPAIFSAATTYGVGDLVRLNGMVYLSAAPAIGITPPATPWNLVGRALPLIYENVNSDVGENGAVQMQISWLRTDSQSIGCFNGSLRSISGVLSCWIYSPRSVGTSMALRDSMRLRSLLSKWRSVSDCGKQVRVHAINGPRSVTPRAGNDFHLHVISCSLTAMERIQTLR